MFANKILKTTANEIGISSLYYDLGLCFQIWDYDVNKCDLI